MCGRIQNLHGRKCKHINSTHNFHATVYTHIHTFGQWRHISTTSTLHYITPMANILQDIGRKECLEWFSMLLETLNLLIGADLSDGLIGNNCRPQITHCPWVKHHLLSLLHYQLQMVIVTPLHKSLYLILMSCCLRALRPAWASSSENLMIQLSEWILIHNLEEHQCWLIWALRGHRWPQHAGCHWLEKKSTILK